MIRQIGKKKYRVFGYDVESHNDEESIDNNETSIWLSCFMDETGKVDDEGIYFFTIESWLERLRELSKPSHHNISNLLIYIFNLSFEWSFILPKLLDMGFKWKESIDRNDEMVFNSISTKTCSSVWQCTIKFHKGSEIILRDLRKILMGSLESVAKSFHTPTQKGVDDIDYTLNRLHGHVVTDIEKAYCFKDVRILVEILMEMDKRDDKDFWKCCSASSYACSKMINQGYGWAKKKMKAFRKDYPILDSAESTFLRKATSGGITYAPSLYQYKEIKVPMKHIDIHQAHPNSAYRHKFPYGRGTYFNQWSERPNGGMHCIHVKVSYDGVKLHNCIRLIGIDVVDDYDIYAWDFEIQQMYQCYENFHAEFIEGYNYRTKMLPWRKFYKDNYEMRKIAKKNKDDFEIHQRKLLNNSSYGKLLEHGHRTCFENIIDFDGCIDSIERDSTPKKRKSSDMDIEESLQNDDYAKFTCLQVGGVIPAYTRHYLIETALKLGWKNIVYFDTDSIFYLDNAETRENIKNVAIGEELGEYGFENDIINAQFTAPKRYKLTEIDKDGKKENVYHCAGINFNVKSVRQHDGSLKFYCAGHEVNDRDALPTFDELNIIDGVYDIQCTRRCKGGTLIVMKRKEMGVQPKYQHIFDTNNGKTII